MTSSNSRRPHPRSGDSIDGSIDHLLRSTPNYDHGSPDLGTHSRAQSENSIELATIHPYHTESRPGPVPEPEIEQNSLPMQQASIGARSNYQPLPSAELDEGTEGNVQPPTFSMSFPQGHNRSFWTPYTLQWPFLSTTLLVTLVLTLTVVFLLVYSAVRHGLGPDDGSSAILFGWRFAPTLVTVLYAVLTLMILKDAQRTEPFAQMSHSTGAASKSSICRKEGFWWNEIRDSMRKTQNHGRINFHILAIVSLHTINALLINTLSSSLLQSQDVDLQSTVPFTRYSTAAESPVVMAADSFVYFQTISNVLQNLTTSPWLTEKYAVIPFWPASAQADIRLLPTGNLQQWNATTNVFSVELDCEPMEIHYALYSENLTDSDGVSTTFKSWLLTDSQGCQAGLNFESNEQLLYVGGGSWFTPPNFTTPSWDAALFYAGPKGPDEFHNSTQQCDDRQVIFTTNSSQPAPNSSVQALSCQSTFYLAEMPVGVSMNTTATTVSVDDGQFNASRTLLSGNSILDEERFETVYTNANWSAALFTPDPNARFFGGPLGLLAAIYDFDPVSMVLSDSLIHNAQKIKQRFLGEMIMASVNNNPHSSQMGQVTNIERRVVVNVPIAISLIVLLSISSILMVVVLYTSRKRPLNVYSDPTSIAAATRLIDGNSTLHAALYAADQNGKTDLHHTFRNMSHSVVDGRLLTQKMNGNTNSSNTSTEQKSRDWRPFVIRQSASLLLVLLLALVFAVTLILFIIAQTIGLYETAFTYQAVLGKGGNDFEFIPFSIVPTFVAVIIATWWTSFSEAFQRLQTFIEMAETTVPIVPSVTLSYANMTPLSGVARALRNRNWMIAVVCVAALLTQVLTVSMSAIWERAGGARDGTVELTRTLEPRGIPFEYNFNIGTSAAGGSPVGVEAFSDLFGHLTQNWLYSATLQLSYNGSEPGWSTEGWSFVPVDLSSIVSSSIYKSTPSDSLSDLTKGVNVTLTTPALRGTLDCSPILSTTNISSWLTQQDLTNVSIWNVTENPSDWQKGFEINKIFELNAEASFSTTPILSDNRRAPICCANSTSDSQSASAIAYWSNNKGVDLSYNFDPSSGPYPRNFTVKWIVGDAHPRSYLMNKTWSTETLGVDDDNDLVHLIWPTAPTMSALNCRPRIQWTNASVTVDMMTGKVHKYTITDPITDFDWPWTDVYASHNITDPGPDVQTRNPDQITISSGVLFQDAMMVAANLRTLWAGEGNDEVWSEDLDDKTFNFRLPEKGLNTDLMSYSMYQLASGNLTTLTDHTSMTQLSEKVFSTFFQHFASYNVSSGGWAMQQIGAHVNPDLGPTLNSSLGVSTTPINQPQNVTFTSDTRVTAHVEIEVEVLEMSPPAVYITLVILLLLVIVTLLAYFVGFRHVGVLKHDFDDLASVFGAIYASEKLREWVRMNPGVEGWRQVPNRGRNDVPRVHLGSFAAVAGEHQTWGIEIVDDGKESKRA